MTINLNSRSGYEMLRFWAAAVHSLLVSLHLRALTLEGLSNYDHSKIDMVPLDEMKEALRSLDRWERTEALATIRYLFKRERTERGTQPTTREYVANVRANQTKLNAGGGR